ncbi:WD repeat-containing protein 81 [Teleopsis dalmanni]|uniref:WD repeat-containing protein 81 n=1 Tax=Teleopsis dalmanni TaxID=139649 RepID=UPI0018CEC4C2|nr:WD repeat-containing protein 81 [Teleopsis dalmanni]
MDVICTEIGIDAQHVCETVVPGRFNLICDKQWLQNLEKYRKITTFPVNPLLDRRVHPVPLKHPWTRILVQTFKKNTNLNVFPLPHLDTIGAFDAGTLPLSFSQAVAYVSNTNFKNLWESAHIQYSAARTKFCKKTNPGKTPTSTLVPYDFALKDLIQRIYNCPVIHCKLDRYLHGEEFSTDSSYVNKKYGVTVDNHPNILPAIVAIETSTHISVLFYPPALMTSLYDCITYSPAILNKSLNKSLFLIYQLLELLKHMQSKGLFLGDVRLHDILVSHKLWIQVFPKLEASLLNINNETHSLSSQSEILTNDINYCTDIKGDSKVFINDKVNVENTLSTNIDSKLFCESNQFALREYCEMWCNGQLSNFDYLTILNEVSGRSLKNPAYHHIMPWVSDFAARNGLNWRDLSKSKYRLNKGDIHLDLMFSNANNQNATDSIPHHVSDFLSEITYFVYMARRTPQNVLCEHVRPIWVPAEYPVSIQRLQEWTPDECIPEFYTDPMIFKSIHEDLPDLEVPGWASCPEDFIIKHREALESQHVSERLQHWIDLNFGYKLTGKAAIRSKNVCLSLVDQHKNLCQRGIVQLFTHPHPAKRFPSLWFTKLVPRLSYLHNSNSAFGASSKSKLHKKESIKRLARSTENLFAADDSPIDYHMYSSSSVSRNTITYSPRLHLQKTLINDDQPGSSFYQPINFIELPADYTPCALMQNLETTQSFFTRTFSGQKLISNENKNATVNDVFFDLNSKGHSFTNPFFATCPNFEIKRTVLQHEMNSQNISMPSSSYLKKHILKTIISEKRERELQVIGCIIVEVFAIQRLRPYLTNSLNSNFSERLSACRTVAALYKQEIPKCLRYIVQVLLQVRSSNQVSYNGLPPLGSTQIIEPIFSNLILPFPKVYSTIYALLRSLRAFDLSETLLNLITHFNCNGEDCSKYSDLNRKRLDFEQKIAECKIMSCCTFISVLLEPGGYEQFSPVEILLPYIIDLLTAENTSILTAWNLFDPIAQALGIANTQKFLLSPILKLYDVTSMERERLSAATETDHQHSLAISSFKSEKSAKLYHHSFLSRLIVRFGLQCFLQNFITPIIEAVRGYKEPADDLGFYYYNNLNNSFLKTTTKNLYCSADDEISSTALFSEMTEEQVNNKTSTANVISTQINKEEIEDIFIFDDDIKCELISNSYTSEEKSEDSFKLRSTVELKEAISQSETPEYTDSDIFTKPSGYESTTGIKSPEIKIPPIGLTCTNQLSTINCEIGSKKSVNSFEEISGVVEEHCKEMEMQQKNENTEYDTKVREDRKVSQVPHVHKTTESETVQSQRISEMSAESLVWLSYRLGPVLTSRYIARNLLKLASLCYVGQENLLPEVNISSDHNNLNKFSITDARVVGDRTADTVFKCLASISALYGEEVILFQYLPYIGELIVQSSNRITGNLEGAIISSLQLLKCIIPCLKDVTIMERLKDILESILLPIVRFLDSTPKLMPNSFLGRSVLTRKLLDAVYVLCIRIGPDMSKEHLCIPVLRPFFLIFDKVYGSSDYLKTSKQQTMPFLPTNTTAFKNDTAGASQDIYRANEEIRYIFSPELAHSAYLSFLRFLGEAIMQRTLLNLQLILTLCHEYEQPNYKSSISSTNTNNYSNSNATKSTDIKVEQCLTNSFGTYVVGNRIELANAVTTEQTKQDIGPMEVLDMVAYKFEQIPTGRHVRGNWLSYWRHEVGRSDQDSSINLKQIKLQSFSGHTNSVRSIIALDNENSFISSSKDKTVKIWSLRNEGDGKTISSCQFTYTDHKKSINSLAYLDAMRYAVSCDSGVHIWDPFIGRPLGILESPKYNPVTIVKCLSSPSPLLIAGTAESTVKIIDSRCMQYVNEWRVCPVTQGNLTIRCIAVTPSSNWFAVGLSSGSIVMLDSRTGQYLNGWRPIECDLLQLTAPNDHQLISSALDHSLAVWHANDGILHYQLRPSTEPAHFLQTIGKELVYATTGNRIGIYSDINSSHATNTVIKLRPEIFRGVLTSLAILPLNRLFLAGNESGNIVLFS